MKSVLEHLQDRHLDTQLHQPWVDEVERVATFWLYNLSGCVVGYQQYRPDADKNRNNDPKLSRYYTYRNKNVLTVWGLESLALKPGVLFLTEGVFDAARFTELGYPALAVLSNDPKRQLREWLKCLNRRVVAVCDNDAAGRRLAKFGDVAVFTEDHDLGDSSEEFVLDLVSKYG